MMGEESKNRKQYHGYLALPRHAIMLQNNLGYSHFSLYLALIMSARWYRGNPQFGCVVGTQADIATRLNISQSKLSRGINKLFTKKYVIPHKNFIRLVYFPLFLTDVAKRMDKNNYADLHELYAEMYRINAELQEKYALSQEKRSQNASQSLKSSFKVNLSSFDSSREELDLDVIDKAISGVKGL